MEMGEGLERRVWQGTDQQGAVDGDSQMGSGKAESELGGDWSMKQDEEGNRAALAKVRIG
jgi:hypothetical protein